MKSFFKTGILLVVVIFLNSQVLHASDDLVVNANKTLYVVYMDSAPSVGSSKATLIRSENDRRSRFEKNFKTVFKKEKWDAELKFERWPFEAPEKATVLTVEVLSLRSSVQTQIELKYSSKLSVGTDVTDFGIDLIRAYPNMAMSSGLDRDIDKMYKDAAGMVAKNLNKHLFKK